MPRFVQTDLAGAGDREVRDATPALVLDRRCELGALSLEFLDRVVDVVAHEEQSMVPRPSPPARAGMHSDLGRRQREDQPAVACVHALEAQHVAQERAGSLGIFRKDDRVRPSDHAGIVVSPEAAGAPALVGGEGGPGRGRAARGAVASDDKQ
jgi:hypothetical protein